MAWGHRVLRGVERWPLECGSLFYHMTAVQSRGIAEDCFSRIDGAPPGMLAYRITP